MTENIETSKADEVTTDEPFGGCPHCGKSEDCLEIELVFWFVCHTHHTKWKLGVLVSERWNGTAKQWRKNAFLLWDYEDVDPIYRQRVTCARCQADITGNRHDGHSPLCRFGNDTSNPLSDEVVAEVLKRLNRHQYEISRIEDKVRF